MPAGGGHFLRRVDQDLGVLVLVVVMLRLARVDSALQHDEHLVAQRFTAADISVAYALQLARLLGLHKQFPEAVQAYWARLKQRPAFEAAKKAQEAAAVAA